MELWEIYNTPINHQIWNKNVGLTLEMEILQANLKRGEDDNG